MSRSEINVDNVPLSWFRGGLGKLSNPYLSVIGLIHVIMFVFSALNWINPELDSKYFSGLYWGRVVNGYVNSEESKTNGGL